MGQLFLFAYTLLSLLVSRYLAAQIFVITATLREELSGWTEEESYLYSEYTFNYCNVLQCKYVMQY